MVKVKTVKDYLAENPFFNEMEDRHIKLLSGCGKIIHFEAGAFLLKEGEDANSFYMIIDGDVAIESYMPAGGPMMVSKVGAGGITGFSWLFPPYRSQFDSRALTKVRAIHLDGKCLRGKAENDHELGYHLMKRFARIVLSRMQDTRRQMLDVYGTEKKIATESP